MNKLNREVLHHFKDAPLKEKINMIATLKHALKNLTELLKKMEWEIS